MKNEPLLNRIRGEYREMPGLRLTLAQACRLWQIESAECAAALDALVRDGELARTLDGAFVALPRTARPVKAELRAPQRASAAPRSR